jgi:hypothetical protein
VGKLQPDALTAEQYVKVMAALNAGKAVDALTQAALQKALNGAPLSGAHNEDRRAVLDSDPDLGMVEGRTTRWLLFS